MAGQQGPGHPIWTFRTLRHRGQKLSCIGFGRFDTQEG